MRGRVSPAESQSAAGLVHVAAPKRRPESRAKLDDGRFTATASRKPAAASRIAARIALPEVELSLFERGLDVRHELVGVRAVD